MFPQISIKRLTSSVTLPVHEPISFDFDEIFKAKAEFMAELERSKLENAESVWEIILKTPRAQKAIAEELRAEETFEYPYSFFGGYAVVDELSELRRKKNRR